MNRVQGQLLASCPFSFHESYRNNSNTKILHDATEALIGSRKCPLTLTPSLVKDLKEWKGENKELTESVIHIPKQFLRTFDDDLLAAGIAMRVPVDANGRPIPIVQGKPVTTPAKWVIDKRDPHGRVVDLHALRHTFGTRLVANGVDIKTTQSLMRHSTASLTLSIYVHKDSQRMAAAVAALPTI